MVLIFHYGIKFHLFLNLSYQIIQNQGIILQDLVLRFKLLVSNSFIIRGTDTRILVKEAKSYISLLTTFLLFSYV